ERECAALFGKSFRDRQSDAAAGAGDDREFSFERLVAQGEKSLTARVFYALKTDPSLRSGRRTLWGAMQMHSPFPRSRAQYPAPRQILYGGHGAGSSDQCEADAQQRGLHAVTVLGANEREELLAGLLLLAEDAEHGGGDGGGVLLFHAAHHHAEVTRLNDHADALRLDDPLDGLGDLGGKAFLHLQASREDVHQSGELAEANHFAARNVGDVHLPVKRQEMMLAKAEHLDVLNDHHLVIVHREESTPQQAVRIFVVALGQVFQGTLHALGRMLQSFAVRIFAQAGEELADEFGEAGGGQGVTNVRSRFDQRDVVLLRHDWLGSPVLPLTDRRG